jgi:hypothetical protein
MKSDRRGILKRPADNGVSGDPPGYRSKIASPRASREPAIE